MSEIMLSRCPVRARSLAGQRTFQRFQSSTATGLARFSKYYDPSHVAAGAAGGATVLLGGYVWYHYSGVKRVVDSSTAAAERFEEIKHAIVGRPPKNPNQALDRLRTFAQSYLVVVPGARPHVDAALDTIDELRDEHGNEVNRIVGNGYEEVRVIIRDADNMDAVTAMKLLDVMRRRTAELEELGRRVGVAFGSLGQKYTQVLESLGGDYEKLKMLAQAKGPETKKVLDEANKQIRQVFSKGLSQDNINQARELIQSKTAAVRKVAQASSQEAWDKSLMEVTPYLDKLPEVKQIVSENASSFVSAGATSLSGVSSSTQELFSRIKDAAQGDVLKDKEKMIELRDYVKQRATEAERQSSQQLERGWQSLQEWVRAMPGGGEALQRVPDVEVFVQVSRDGSEKAKRLTRETYEEVLRVLEEKEKEAKRLSQEIRKTT